MEQLSQIVGSILILAGSFFFVVGAVGIYRMPDVFTRMHAAGISDTVGAGLLLVGMMLWAGLTLVSVKLAIILGVVLFTSPIATHALAQAALHAGIEPILASKETLVGPDAGDEPKASRRRASSAKRKAAKASATKRKTDSGRKAPKGSRRKRS